MIYTSVAFSQEKQFDFNEHVKSAGLITDDIKGIASGFFVNENTFVTNEHVVSMLNMKKAYVKLKSGETYRITEVIESSKTSDLALLRINSSVQNYYRIYEADTINSGTRVYAIGNPTSAGILIHDFTLTDGIVNKVIDRFNFRGFDVKAKVIMHSASLNSGNSGGPLLNSNGIVVGVNSFYDRSSNNLYFSVFAGELISMLKRNNVAYNKKSLLDSLKKGQDVFAKDSLIKVRPRESGTWNYAKYVALSILFIVIIMLVVLNTRTKKKSKLDFHTSNIPNNLYNLRSDIIPKNEEEKPRAYFIYYGNRYIMEKSSIVIGRDISSELCINDPSISGSHCRITYNSDVYSITDLGSKNGTYVNGFKIRREILRDGDTIKLGRTKISFNKH